MALLAGLRRSRGRAAQRAGAPALPATVVPRHRGRVHPVHVDHAYIVYILRAPIVRRSYSLPSDCRNYRRGRVGVRSSCRRSRLSAATIAADASAFVRPVATPSPAPEKKKRTWGTIKR
jgi:hypothetical protein